MTKPPGKCIFCGEGGLTKEHLFSDWLTIFFPRDDLDTHTFGVIAFEPRRILSAKSRQGHSGSKQIRKVCVKCNSGWVGTLDTGAKRALSPVFLGFNRTFDAWAQRRIASWIAKIATVGDAMNPDKAKVSKDDRQHLWLQHEPPPNWQIWMAPYSGTAWRDLGIYQHGAWLEIPTVARPSPLSGYLQATMIGMGPILFLVLATDISGLGFSVGRVAVEMKRIWPIGPAFKWMPQFALSDEDADHFGNILERLIAHPVMPDPAMTRAKGATT